MPVPEPPVPLRIRIHDRLDTVLFRAETPDHVTLNVRNGTPPEQLLAAAIATCTDPDLLVWCATFGIHIPPQRMPDFRTNPWPWLGPEIGSLYVTSEIIPARIRA